MNRFLIFTFLSATLANAQSFQPPSWGQGQGTGKGSGQGAGQGQGSGQYALPATDSGVPGHANSQNAIQQQINQLQSQIEHLRAEQRKMSEPHVEMQSGLVAGRPVSGKETRRVTQTLGDGTEISHSDTSYFYRDSAGRMRAEGPNGIEIFDPVAHFSYDVLPSQKAYYRYPTGENIAFVSLAAFGHETHSHVSSDIPASDSAGVTDDLGKQTINGIPAKGTRVTIVIPVGAIGNNHEIRIVNERWYSDDLKILVKSTNTDPRFGTNVYELTDIKQSQPDPALFAPPSDYTLTTRRR
jgi:hypothetical protein